MLRSTLGVNSYHRHHAQVIREQNRSRLHRPEGLDATFVAKERTPSGYLKLEPFTEMEGVTVVRLTTKAGGWAKSTSYSVRVNRVVTRFRSKSKLVVRVPLSGDPRPTSAGAVKLRVRKPKEPLQWHAPSGPRS